MVEQESILQELKTTIRKETILQVSKIVIALIVSLGLAALLGWWLFLKPIVIQALGGVPQGAIAAFDNADRCPDGWNNFSDAAGKTIIGMGKDDNLSNRSFRSAGGQEKITLRNENIPPHTHAVEYLTLEEALGSRLGFTSNNGGWFPGRLLARPWIETDAPAPKDRNAPSRRTLAQESPSTPIDVMPPFLVLRICKKA